MTCADPEEVIWVIEQLVHVKGSLARTPIELEEFQKDYVRGLLELDDEGHRIKRRGLYGIARKNAKSTLVAALAIALLICEREPGMEIIVASGKREQAAIIMDIAKGMANYSKIAGRPLTDFLTVRRDGIYIPELDASMRIISSEGKTAHGLNPSIVIIDELHVFGADDELLAALDTAQGSRRDPLHISLTTAGPMREGPLWDEYTYAKKVAAGEVSDPALHAVWYEAEEGCEIDDWDEIAKANPGLGTIVYREFIQGQINKVRTGRLTENQYRRLHLNQWTSALERFIPISYWRDCHGDAAIADGDPIIISLDAAIKRDSFGVTWHSKKEQWIEDDGGLTVRADIGLVRARMFEAEGENYIDLEDVRLFVGGLGSIHPVEKIIYDPAYLTLFAQQLADMGFDVEPFPQSAEKMTRATETFQRMVLSNRMRWVDACLDEQLAATAIRETDRGVRISKAKSGRNDTIVACAMGLDFMFGEEEDYQDDFVFVV